MKKFLVFSLFILLATASLQATGPSYIHAEIRPISINEKGEILCRTRFEKNPMGAHYPMDIEYGICVITQDTIMQYVTHVLQYSGYPEYADYNHHRNYWNDIFESPFNKNRLSDVEYQAVSDYGFKESNVAVYLVNDTLSIAELAQERDIDLTKNSQKALYGAQGSYDTEDISKKIILLYDFGHLLIIQNSNHLNGEEDWSVIFNYPSGMYGINERGEKEDVGYDYGRITGIVFK